MSIENIKELQKLTILYVEDDAVIREQFAVILEKVFKKVFMAPNGKEGLSLFEKHFKELDFVVSDIQMPHMDGLEMIEGIRKISTEIPCILVTAHGEFDYFMKANDLGVFRYIQKPLNVTELFEAISDFQSGREVKKIDL